MSYSPDHNPALGSGTWSVLSGQDYLFSEMLWILFVKAYKGFFQANILWKIKPNFGNGRYNLFLTRRQYGG